MLEPMHLSALVAPLDARLNGADVAFDSVSIDSRAVRAGGLFVALPGSRVDGHAFLAKAREQGAVAALVERAVDDPLPQLLVADAQRALGQLAALARKAFHGPLIAITGSSGKTSVKEMLAAILRERGAVLATRGNLNNELGVPLTLLELTAEHQFAVIEMGAASIGDIAYSMQLAAPTVSVLTNAGSAHVGRFGSLENIARTKGEIFEGLAADGRAVVNLDSPWFAQWQQTLGSRKYLSFSLQDTAADVHAASIRLDASGRTGFELLCAQGQIEVHLALLGRHNVANALAAAAAALTQGCSLQQIAQGLERLQPVAGRACSLPGKQGALIIDDSYNANPASVKAAIDLLADFDGQRILVLGDMGELGDWAQSSHREIGDYARQKGLDALYAVGSLSALAVEHFGAGGRLFASKSELIDVLNKQLNTSTRVLIKGSRSAGMETVVAGLVEHSQNDNDTKAG